MRSPVRHTVGIIAAGTALGLAAIGAAGAATAPAPAAGSARPVTAYVVNSGDGTVTPISTATNRPGRAIRILPAGDDHLSLFVIEITPDGRTAYVLANGAPGTLTPFSTTTSKPGAPITTGLASAMAITPNGKTLYLADDNIVITVNTATNKPGRPIPLPICAGSIAITRTAGPPTPCPTAAQVRPPWSPSAPLPTGSGGRSGSTATAPPWRSRRTAGPSTW